MEPPQSKYMLLNAPHRFQLKHLTPLPHRLIAEDYLSVCIPDMLSLFRHPDPNVAALAQEVVANNLKSRATDAVSAMQVLKMVRRMFPDELRDLPDLASFKTKPFDSGSAPSGGERETPAGEGENGRADTPAAARGEIDLDRAGRLEPDELGAMLGIEGLEAMDESALDDLSGLSLLGMVGFWPIKAQRYTRGIPEWIIAAAGERGPQAVGDAATLQYISLFYSAGLFDAELATRMIDYYGKRIVESYSGWEQYLASFAFGSIDPDLKDFWQNPVEFDSMDAVHGLAVAPSTIFEVADFWPAPDLERLGDAVRPLLPEEKVREQMNYAMAMMPQTTVPFPDIEPTLDEDFQKELDVALSEDREKCERAGALAEEVWIKPAEELGVAFFLFDVTNSMKLSFPASDPEHMAVNNKFFWFRQRNFGTAENPIEGVPFLNAFEGLTGHSMTSLGVYRIAPDVDRGSTMPIPWDQVEFSCTVTAERDIRVDVNGETLCDVEFDFEALGLPVDYRMEDEDVVKAVLAAHIMRLHAFLSGLPSRVLDWRAKNLEM